MPSAVSYLRCSGESQVTGDTWARQQAIVQKYAAANGIEIVREFRDEGVTGKMELENREGLSACIAFVREREIGLVLVEDGTRLARDLIVAEVCIREFQKAGVRVVAASGGLDLTEGDDANPMAKLVRQILSAISEFERCVIVLRLRGARQRKKIEDGLSKGYTGDDAAKFGKCDGRKAFGEKPGEAEYLTKIKAMRAAGYNSQRIADALNMQGVPSRTGRPWRASVVAKILARERQKAA
jgi:DNA invertase Pin-like site-specific DNA recombinase